MKIRAWLATALCAAMAAGAYADSIRVNGQVYTGIKISQSGTRYYFRTPDGQPMSVAKEKIAPEDIAFGDKPLSDAAAPSEEAPPLASDMPVHETDAQPEEATVPMPAPDALPLPVEEEPAPAPAPEPEPAPEPDPAPAPAPAPEPEPSPTVEEPPAPLAEPTPEEMPEPEVKMEEAPKADAKPEEPAPAPEPEESKAEETKTEETKAEEPAPAPEPEQKEEPAASEEKPETPPAPEVEPVEMKEAPAPEPPQEEAPAQDAPPAEQPAADAPVDEEAPAAEATPAGEEAPAAEEAPTANAPAMPEPVVGTVTAGAARVVDGASPDPLANFEVNALVIGVGDQRAAFCSADVPVLDSAMHAAVLAKLSAAGSKVNPQALMLAATGSNTGWRRGVVKGVLAETLFGKYDEAAKSALADAFVQAISTAESAMVPAEYVVGESEAPDYHKPRPDSSPSLDSTLGVMLVQNHDGEPLGAIINYAIQPPVEVTDKPLNARGIAGRIVEELRARTKSDLPVLFFNGAAEDLDPALGDTPEAKKENSGKIAQLAMDALKGATAKRESSMAAVTWQVPMPPTLLGDVLPSSALATEIRLSGDRFIAMPGLPAAQIGNLLRVKALEQGAGQVFLCALTNDYLGVQPGITEFFSESKRAMMAFHGPLVIKWYADHFVLNGAEKTAWKMAPELADRVAAYEAGVKQGQERKAELDEGWKTLEKGLTTLANMLVGMRKMAADKVPPEVDALLANLPPEQLPLVARQAAATYLRTSAADYAPEQRTTLMGIAEGAGLPYDAVLLMDMLADTAGLPEQVKGILVIAQVKGHKILE